MTGVNVYIGEDDIKDEAACISVEGGKRWVTARAIGYRSWWHTIKCSWLVLTGEADIVIWREEENNK